ncbi:uncharacterized protein A4U43_C01F5580 [Asparagus officinalis]|uniref:Uncharacterized protein n=1 Tax=Asparagus officinalis TaxID=4686 RepID=A0A5P1FRM0_ASPOF|nr:uncharacterized protein A4U43_C01F5580 [Asparagus officinalis]
MIPLFVLCLLISTLDVFVKAEENTTGKSSLCEGTPCNPNVAPPPPNYIQYKEAPPPPPPPSQIPANCPPVVVVPCCQYTPPAPSVYTPLPYGNNYSAALGRAGVGSSNSVLFGGLVVAFFVVYLI